jgi:hypothetical protein
MRVFLLDLWMDLREKRLAPIALALLAGIVAVPLVLAKAPSEPPPPPAATTASAAPLVVKSKPQAGPVDSKLQTFSPRDPFEPTSAAAAPAAGGGGSTPTSGGTGTSTSTSTTPTPSGGGGGTTGGGTTTTPTPSGGGTTTTPKTKTVIFTYTVDLRFGAPGDQKLFKGVQRLELIPDADTPRIVFLGVTTSGKTAAFLVDSNFAVDTSGKCQPRADQCTFLYLRPDGTHDQATLTDDQGNIFRVRLIKIHRVVVSSANGNSGTGTGTGTGRSPAFTGKADSNQSGTAPGDAPPGEPARPTTFRGFFGDEVK